jgi:hypothetical protein
LKHYPRRHLFVKNVALIGGLILAKQTLIDSRQGVEKGELRQAGKLPSATSLGFFPASSGNFN